MVLPLVLLGVPLSAAACYGAYRGGQSFATDSVLGRTPTSTIAGTASSFAAGAGVFNLVMRAAAFSGDSAVASTGGSFEEKFWRANAPRVGGFVAAVFASSLVIGACTQRVLYLHYVLVACTGAAKPMVDSVCE